MEKLLEEILVELKKMNAFFEGMEKGMQVQAEKSQEQFKNIMSMVPPEMRGMFGQHK